MASLGARKVSLEDLARAAEYLQLQDLLDLVTVKVHDSSSCTRTGLACRAADVCALSRAAVPYAAYRA